MAERPVGDRFAGTAYSLVFAADRPYVYVFGADGSPIAELFALSSVHPLVGRDDTTRVGPWERETRGSETVFSCSAGSSVWAWKTYRFRCTADRFRYEVTVHGQGDLVEISYFGGYSSATPNWGTGFFASGSRFETGFNPEPNAAGRPYFDPLGGAAVDLGGGPLPGRRHWFFTPAPFCLAFRTGGQWVGIGVECGIGEHRFTEYRYHGGDGFHLTLAYDGRTAVAGETVLPAIGFDFGPAEYEVLRKHVAAVRSGFVTRMARSSTSIAPPQIGTAVGTRRQADWWSRPIFCGWGAQCREAAREHGYRVPDSESPDIRAFLETLAFAPRYSRQDRYETFLASLAAHAVEPGTVVIDDKWQRSYGENDVDHVSWPDLPGFIGSCHERGRHVLLWLKAWDPEGLPVDECITNAAGTVLTADPTNPAYERRLRTAIHRLLSHDGYDADGFKIDFTHRIATGPGLRAAGDAWGLELMRCYLRTIYEAAKEAKPDALVMTHTPHPYLSDVVDMIRLNDAMDLTRLDDAAAVDIAATLTHRAQVAHIACPEALVDTDNWPVRNRQQWREYVRLQPHLGVPSLYFAGAIDLTQEPLEERDYALIREVWDGYAAR
ncbi:MAG TPA: hypothetical protein VKX16_07440 [Chloroflexota bacterium]|nr:hypothetical protein [Chloroflexota bacterium]